MAFKENGRENSGKTVLDWVEEASELGAGEFLVTSIDKDGTKNGFDKPLYEKICSRVKVPVIACGGAGSDEDILDLMRNTQCSGVALGSILHYGISSVKQIKHSLQRENVRVRPEPGNIIL